MIAVAANDLNLRRHCQSKMKVELVSWSQGSCHKGSCPSKSIQDMVAFCARVSNPTNQANTETNERLLRYLIRNQHWSPFEMVSVCLEIETTRDIGRQILRHRSFSFQEFSQRYAAVDSTELEQREARAQDKANRQNSVPIESGSVLEEEWFLKQAGVAAAANHAYTWALQAGIAKEVARAVLPEGMTQSRLYMNGSLRSWIHYIQLRSANGTQKEHREVALACAAAIAPIFPLIAELIQKSD